MPADVKCITSGVISDIETFLARFAQTGSLRYTDFSRIWRDMKLSMIFAGRQNDRECREFTEHLFKIVLNYFLPPFGLQTRVGSLYMLYGLFFKQLFEPKVKIRMTLAQWKDTMLFLMEEIRPQSHWDVEFVFHKLRFSHAFHYVALPTELYPLMRNQAQEGDGKQETDRQPQSAISELLSPDNVEQLSDLHEQYHRMKCSIGDDEDAVSPPQQLNMVRDDLVQQLTRIATSFEEWKKAKMGSRKGGGGSRTEASESEAESDADIIVQSKSSKKTSDSIGQKRAEIRARAFADNAPLGTRHTSVTTIGSSLATTPMVESSKHNDAVKPKGKKSKRPDTASANVAVLSCEEEDVGNNIKSQKTLKQPKRKAATSKSPKNCTSNEQHLEQTIDIDVVPKKGGRRKSKGPANQEEESEFFEVSAVNTRQSKAGNSKKQKRSDVTGAVDSESARDEPSASISRKSPRKRKGTASTVASPSPKRPKKSAQSSTDTAGMGGLREQLRAALKDCSKQQRKSLAKNKGKGSNGSKKKKK